MITEAMLTDGTRGFIWPLLHGDAEALREGFETLSLSRATTVSSPVSAS